MRRKMLLRKRTAAILVAVVVGLVVTTSATAHTKRFKTRVTNSEPTPGNYQGRVLSHSGACVRNRPLKIWRDVPEAEDEFIHAFRADAEGRWEYHFFGLNYYVTAKRLVKTPGEHRHVCKGDRSPTA